MSQVTTHILDTTTGKPAAGIEVTLSRKVYENWEVIAHGITNADGRIPELVKAEHPLHGIYTIRFEISEYFTSREIETFYPFVEISFHVEPGENYHIPLLLNPYGYTTYRGS